MGENTSKDNYLKLVSIGVIYEARCCAYCYYCDRVFEEASGDAVGVTSMCSKHSVPVKELDCCDYFTSSNQ